MAMPERAPILAPAELAELDHWVCWRLETRDGRQTKVPYRAATGFRHASTTDPETWTDYLTARTFRARNPWVSGIGYVLTVDDPFCGIDLDHCVEPDGIADWAQAIVGELDSYTEISPSGTGLRIFVRGSLPPGGKRKGKIEMYTEGRFLTITGNRVAGTPPAIHDRQEALAALHARVFPAPAPQPQRPATAARTPLPIDDAGLLQKAFQSQHGDAIRRLWNGDWSATYDSQSQADMALVSHLGFWTGADSSRMDALFRQSGLYRPKWDSKRGTSTYGADTIAKVVPTITEVYTPAPERLVVPPNGHVVNAAGQTVDTETGEVVEVGTPAYAWQSLADLVTQVPEARVELVKGLIWQGRTHWVYGQAGSGKTLLYLAAAMHLAAGKAFGERAVRQGAVLIFEEDTPLSVMGEYVTDLADIYDFDLASLPCWITREQGLRLTHDEGLERAKAAVLAAPEVPSLVLLDASEALMPSDRFTPREFDYFKQFILWCLSRGITVIVIDHIKKSQSAGKTVDAPATDPVELLYGGLPKRQMSDVMVYLTGKIAAKARLTYTKFRGRLPTGHDVAFDGAKGFTITDLKRVFTDTEQAVIRTLNNAKGRGDGLTKEALEEGCPGHSPKSIQRACKQLLAEEVLVREGATSALRYRLAATVPGVFRDA